MIDSEHGVGHDAATIHAATLAASAAVSERRVHTAVSVAARVDRARVRVVARASDWLDAAARVWVARQRQTERLGGASRLVVNDASAGNTLICHGALIVAAASRRWALYTRA